MFSSEIKGMSSYDGEIVEFEPGTIVMTEKNLSYYSSQKFDMTKVLYENKQYLISTGNHHLSYIRNSVINSIKRRLNADRPLAFLLSGGVDSSLVASISASILGIPIRTFCCGIKGSTDMIYAKLVAKHIGSNHSGYIKNNHYQAEDRS
jgi:asparagine synthase (glutamine-hydrolysing)